MRRQVLVTGVSSGLGRAIAAELDEAGFDVWGTVRTEADAAALRRDGDRIRPVLLELTDPESVERAAGRLRSSGPLYAVINNAGAAVPTPLEHADPAMITELLATNVVGPLRLTQELLPALRQARHSYGDARVIFVGSLITAVPLPLFGPYALTKHALVGLTDSLRAELAPERIRVSLIEPGVFATRIWLRAHDQVLRLPRHRSDDRYRALLDAAPTVALLAHRYGADPAAMAAAVARALTRSAPPARQFVPGHARLVAAATRLLPTRVLDAGAAALGTDRGAAGLRALARRLLRLRRARGARQAARDRAREAARA
ncbi:SDR family NAD(P)-dependent oxidoreductase [Microlunatus parietis]